MVLPVNVKDLIERRVVENTRIEYKAGYNPESIIHSICAFANDIENVGGGYIIIGMVAENGVPLVASKKLDKSDIDAINKDLLNKCNLIEPRYIPVTELVEYRGASVFVIWAYAGDSRPYKCPTGFPNDKNPKKEKFEKACYIRKLGSTIKANIQEERELYGLGGIIPFDDRVNRAAQLDDLNPMLITNFLYRVGSGLYDLSKEMQLDDLAESMQIAGSAGEQLKPKNVGLLFFNNTHGKFFRYPQIEVVDKPDPTGEGMIEKIFKGPLDRQLEDALTFIKNYIVKEKIRKFPDKPEAERIFNYPIRAVEEALANAVYHKAYDIAEPITVTVTPDRMEITSIPGPDRSISDDNLKSYKMISKKYRNRRIGDFLKELKMVEGRNTGIPTILLSLENNGSPKPIFETDADRSYFTVVFPVHKEFLANAETKNARPQREGSKRTQAETKDRIMAVLDEGEITTQNLVKVLGYSTMTKGLRKTIQDLIQSGKISYTIPEQPNNRNQKLKKI